MFGWSCFVLSDFNFTGTYSENIGLCRVLRNVGIIWKYYLWNTNVTCFFLVNIPAGPQFYLLYYNFSFLLEKNTIIGVSWENRTVLIYLACFALVQFIFKSILSYVLKESGATAVQLYLLTADFYTLIVGIVFKNYKVRISHISSYISQN